MKGISWQESFVPLWEGVTLQDYRKKGNNVVVIAPHPDDDVLGAGGVMIQAVEQGRSVFSITITDGRGSPGKNWNISDEELAARRQKEAIAALKVVGAAGVFFLQKQSLLSEEKEGAAVERELKEIWEWLIPQEVYLPGPYERHRTHIQCTRMGIQALRASGVKPLLLGYSLWGCFWGGKSRVVRDIGPQIKKKVESVLAHSSQIAYKNYQQGILGRNNSEAIFWEAQEIQKAAFVEVFLDMTEFLENKDLTLEDFIRQDTEDFIKAYL